MIPLRFYFIMLIWIVGSGVYAQNDTIDFSRLSFTNSQIVDRPVWGNDFAISFQGGTTSATYYTTGNAIRIYNGGSFTVSSVTKMITRLVLTFTEKKYAPNSKSGTYANTGTLTVGTRVLPWTGKTADGVTSVTFTRPFSGGQWQLQKIEATFGKAISDSDKVEAKISSTGYSTLYYSKKALIVSPNVTARTYKFAGQKLSVSRTYFPGEVIAAGTAVVLNGEAGEHRFVVARDYTSSAEDPNNILQGTDAVKHLGADADSLFYQLSLNATNESGTIGFYWGAANGGAFTNGAHKAFLKVSKQSVLAAKSLYLFLDETTGIKHGLSAPRPGEKSPAFNLSGQRVGRAYRGVVVQKGRKFVVR